MSYHAPAAPEGSSHCDAFSALYTLMFLSTAASPTLALLFLTADFRPEADDRAAFVVLFAFGFFTVFHYSRLYHAIHVLNEEHGKLAFLARLSRPRQLLHRFFLLAFAIIILLPKFSSFNSAIVGFARELARRIYCDRTDFLFLSVTAPLLVCLGAIFLLLVAWDCLVWRGTRADARPGRPLADRIARARYFYTRPGRPLPYGRLGERLAGLGFVVGSLGLMSNPYNFFANDLALWGGAIGTAMFGASFLISIIYRGKESPLAILANSVTTLPRFLGVRGEYYGLWTLVAVATVLTLAWVDARDRVQQAREVAARTTFPVYAK